MKKRYWFTDENGENICVDYIGNIKGAITYAQKIANQKQKEIFINCGDDIVDTVYCDNKED